MNHFQKAEELLTVAENLAAGPRIGVARTLAAIGQGHAALAQVKATRQETARAAEPDLTALELAIVTQAAVDTLCQWNGPDGPLVVASVIRHLARALEESGAGTLLAEHDAKVRAGEHRG